MRVKRILVRVHRALRVHNYRLAESLLIEIEDHARDNADFLYLLGIYHETQEHWRLARKFYARAIAIDANHESAQANLRRLRALRRPDSGRSASAMPDPGRAGLAKVEQEQTRIANQDPNILKG